MDAPDDPDGPARHCPECGGRTYSGAPGCGRCRGLVDEIVAAGWRGFVRRAGYAAADESALAALIAEEPDRHEWRVVDAALDRLVCAECGDRLGRGPVGCASCDQAHGFRYAAVETDRPGVPPGNEHGIRVNVSVLRRPHSTSPRELLVRALVLPALMDGVLPTTAQAQHLAGLSRGGASRAELAALVDTWRPHA